MPAITRLLPLLLCAAMLAGCKDRAIEQRSRQIREFSDREDRAFRAEAVARVSKEYWTRRGHDWYGRLPNGGGVIRLRNPRLIPAPLSSAAFYRGWHLQLTLAADDWQEWPPSTDGTGPRLFVYALTRHSAQDWNIRVDNGPVTEPLRHEDVTALPPGALEQ